MSSKGTTTHGTGILHNSRIALASLVLAVVVWYVIHETINFQIEVKNIPVTVLPDEGWAVLEQSSESVDVRFRGSQQDIRSLRPDNIQVIIDLRGKAIDGTAAVLVHPRNVKTPSGARPVRVRPERMTFRLDQEGEKTVPVKVDIPGEAPPGYEVGKAVITPASVRITGPRKSLTGIEEIRTAPIDLQGRLQSFKLRTGLVSPDTSLVGGMEPEKVSVEVTMVERATLITMERVKVGALLHAALSPSVDLSPKEVDITLKGRAEVLDDVDPASLRAYVDCTELEAGGRYELPVRVHAPAQVSVDRIEPAYVTIRMGDL